MELLIPNTFRVALVETPNLLAWDSRRPLRKSRTFRFQPLSIGHPVSPLCPAVICQPSVYDPPISNSAFHLLLDFKRDCTKSAALFQSAGAMHVTIVDAYGLSVTSSTYSTVTPCGERSSWRRGARATMPGRSVQKWVASMTLMPIAFARKN